MCFPTQENAHSVCPSLTFHGLPSELFLLQLNPLLPLQFFVCKPQIKRFKKPKKKHGKALSGIVKK